MTDRVARLACVALVLAVVLGGVATPTSVSAQPTDTIAQTGINPDDVSMRITLRENGNAAWAIAYRVRLDTNQTTDAFLSLREDIRANESRYTSQFRTRMESTAATAENATGREMTIRNVSVTATRQQLPQDYGIVTYTFVWTNFAAVDNGTIRAGDALAGLFLDGETSLQMVWPEGYGLVRVSPDPSDLRRGSRVVVWSGPLDFAADEPTLVVREAADPGTQGPTTSPAGGTDGSGGLDPLVLGGFAVLVAAVAAGGWYLYQRRGPSGPPRGPGADASGPDGGSGASQPSAAAEAGASDTPDAAESDAASAGAAGAAGAATEADTDGDAAAGAAASDDADAADAGETDTASEEAPWEDELLSNEERVLALVEHEGGRMKQQEVARTLDWTDAKTSQVVRKMRDADELDAFRLGRENVLVLPDEEFGPGPEPEPEGDE
ncbi:MAG: helix-turn-helix transcriptional regulator [Halobellus sp.]